MYFVEGKEHDSQTLKYVSWFTS